MCTLSWQVQAQGYELWFSRDESVLRPLARPPQPTQDGWALAPVDPQGGGTWLAVNRVGMSFALLNAYEWTPAGEAPPDRISRGTVILALWRLQTRPALEQQLQALVLPLGERYAPFRLLVLWPDGQVAQWCWQGQALLRETAVAPVVSSGAHTAEVQAVRTRLFASLQGDLHGFHSSHWPERGYRSVCMHRPEAHTVSLTRVQVSPTQVRMHYQAGSPCTGQPWQSQRLTRQTP